MKVLRRWLRYRHLLDELAEAPDAVLAELAVPRKALREFAWQCAGVEVSGGELPLARHRYGPRSIALEKASPI
jgi:hypothetical protein